MSDHEHFMQLAIEQAMLAKEKGSLPFGAVVVFKDKIVGKGYDTSKISHDVTAHAEVNALRAACEKMNTIDLSECIIYCTNEPCNMCGCAIFQAEIKVIIMSLTRDDLPKLLRKRSLRLADLAKDISYTPTIYSGVSKARVLALFEGISR